MRGRAIAGAQVPYVEEDGELVMTTRERIDLRRAVRAGAVPYDDVASERVELRSVRVGVPPVAHLGGQRVAHLGGHVGEHLDLSRPWLVAVRREVTWLVVQPLAETVGDIGRGWPKLPALPALSSLPALLSGRPVAHNVHAIDPALAIAPAQDFDSAQGFTPAQGLDSAPAIEPSYAMDQGGRYDGRYVRTPGPGSERRALQPARQTPRLGCPDLGDLAASARDHSRHLGVCWMGSLIQTAATGVGVVRRRLLSRPGWAW